MLLYLLNENCPKRLKSLVGGVGGGGCGGRDEVKNQKSCLIDLTTRHAHAHTHKKKNFVRRVKNFPVSFFFIVFGFFKFINIDHTFK